MTEPLTATAMDIARTARIASSKLARLEAQRRTDALNQLAAELEKHASDILQANQTDCQIAAPLVEQGILSAALFKRLKLDEQKLKSVIDGVRQVAALPDPLGSIDLARELDDGLELYRIACPIGVILVIFEARPDALPQIASLLIRSGNAGLLKGGREAKNSNEAMFACIETALETCEFPPGAYKLVPGRHEVSELLKNDKFIDLVIPRGSSELVRQIQESTKIPVLGHAEGICHLYVDEFADLGMALDLAIDAKTSYPAACNSVETLLVHSAMAPSFLPVVVKAYEKAGVEVRIDAADAKKFGIKSFEPTCESDWSTEYSDLIISIKTVDSLAEAIEHINEYGSGHTDAIVTDAKGSYEIFSTEVNSAGVYWNASTRFADGFRYGFGAEVGISTGKLHPRGPVGIDGITTYKYKLVGKGHVVSNYSGAGARTFTHRNLSAD